MPKCLSVRQVLVGVPPVKAQPKVRKIKLLLFDLGFVKFFGNNINLVVQRVQLRGHVAVQFSKLVDELVRHLNLSGVIEFNHVLKLCQLLGLAKQFGVERSLVATKGLVRIERVGLERLVVTGSDNAFEIYLF